MKTLIINGSPRKNGDTVSLINELLKTLAGDVERIDAYYDALSHVLIVDFVGRMKVVLLMTKCKMFIRSLMKLIM